MNCFFCHLDKKGLKLEKVLENSEFLSMSDAAPVSKGHTLIIPKTHKVSFFDLEPEFVSKLYEFITATKKEIDKKYNPDGYNIGINDGRAAGRSIDHLHIHLIPRYNGDIENPKGGVRNILEKYIPPATPPKEYLD